MRKRKSIEWILDGRRELMDRVFRAALALAQVITALASWMRKRKSIEWILDGRRELMDRC
jgi:hypothetical protein